MKLSVLGPNWRTLQLLSSWTCCPFRRFHINLLFTVFETGPPTCKNINISNMYVFKHIPLSPTIMRTKNKLSFFGVIFWRLNSYLPPGGGPRAFPCLYDSGRIRGVFPFDIPQGATAPGINSINLLHHCKCNSLGTCKWGFWSDIPWKNPGMVLVGILMAIHLKGEIWLARSLVKWSFMEISGINN